MRNKLILFLKGILMGICDVIPGISGGTIAFITGIYTRLINAIKNISFVLVIDFFRYLTKRNEGNLDKFKESIRRLDLGFLVVLFAGIVTSIFFGSRLILFFLDNYFVYTISFFVGLILASAKIIFDNIENHHSSNVLFGFLGLFFGIFLSFLMPKTIVPGLIDVFLGGFLAISAMFLPGISGSFILLILGLYEFMLRVLHDIIGYFDYFIVFMFGAILGAFSISRVVAFLFRKNKCRTLYVLLGLVVGALSIPLRTIYESDILWSFSHSLIMFFMFILGIIVIVFVVRFEKKKLVSLSC